MFKMFKNELNRLFKMPLTLILGIVILGLTLLSTAFYSPTLKESNNINWGNKSSNEIYSTFINNDKYKNYYDSQIDKAQAILNYYTTLNGRSSEASTILSKVFGSYDELKKEIPNGDSPTLGEKYINFTNSLKNFKQTLLNFSSIEDISYIQFIIDNNEYENSLSKLSELIYQCEYYYNIFADKAEASNAIVKFYTENNYDSKLENINLSSMAFLDITINNLIEQVSSAYTKYITYIETIPNTTTFTDTSYEGAENHRLNLKNLLKGTHSISKLLEYMVDSPYLSVYTNKDCVITLQNDLDNAYIAINLNENNRKYYTSHRNAIMTLKNINLTNSLTNFQKDYVLILPHQSVVNYLSDLLNNKVVENRINILNKINSNQNNASNIDIINNIEQYKLLSDMSYKLVIYESVLATSKNVPLAEQSNFYGENLENYNQYEFRSLASLYSYCIENEIYFQNMENPLEFNTTSNLNENKGLEITTYMLRISLILTILSLIVLSVLILPYEWQTRTLRLTLARPVSRTSILFGKLFALLAVGITYLIASLALSLIYSSLIGLSISSTTILTVFNGTKIIKISPIVNLIIILISNIFELLFVLSIIIMISTIFRRTILATIFNFIAVTAIYALNLITTASIACSFLPNTNMNFYKYFIASSSADLTNILTRFFTTPVCLNMNFVLSMLLYIAYLLIFNLISTAVMKCRDF